VTQRRSVGLAIFIVLVAVVWVLVGRRPAKESHGPKNGHGKGAGSSPADERGYDDDSSEERVHAYGSPSAQPQAPATPGLPVLDRERADEMREKIRALLAEAGLARVAATPPPSQSGGSFPVMPPGGPGNQAKSAQGTYIQSVMRQDFFPLAKGCYASANAKSPGLRGSIELNFRIVGDRRVGGVVDQASLGDAGTIQDPDFAECMAQSMMSVSFDAPPGDQEITVTYPISFSPDDDDGGT
jgi:hypothetical protein